MWCNPTLEGIWYKYKWQKKAWESRNLQLEPSRVWIVEEDEVNPGFTTNLTTVINSQFSYDVLMTLSDPTATKVAVCTGNYVRFAQYNIGCRTEPGQLRFKVLVGSG